jgi:signal transduction histidine kinase
MKAKASSRAPQSKRSFSGGYVPANSPQQNQFAGAEMSFRGASWYAISEAILQAVSDGIVVADSQGNIVLANWAAKQLAQLDPVGKGLELAPTIWGEMFDLDERHVPISEWPCIKALHGESTVRQECHLVRRNGSSFHVLFSASPISPAGCKTAGAITTLTDITEYRRKSLSRRVEEMSRDRDRIAADIHDSVLQSLNAVVLELETAELELVEKSVHSLNRLHHALETARVSLKEIRRSVWALSSESLENEDPGVALSFLARKLFEGTRVNVHLTLQKEPSPLSPEIRRELVQIGKEALVNALKYARAATVHIELSYETGQMRLSVSDDGQGFILTSLPTEQSGFGILSMRNRAKRLGGKFTIESRPGHGTKISAVIPFPTHHLSTSSNA